MNKIKKTFLQVVSNFDLKYNDIDFKIILNTFEKNY